MSFKSIVNNNIPLLNTFRAINQLECTRRYSQIQLSREETVLEHTGFVVLFITYAYYECLSRYRVDELVEPFNLGDALHRAAMHDIDESVTGDIPRTTKYATAQVRDLFSEVERSGVIKLGQEALNLQNGVLYEFVQRWENAKDESAEGYVVKVADLVAVVYRLWVEVLLRNNMCMLPVAHGVTRYLEEFRRKAKYKQYCSECLSSFISDTLDQSLQLSTTALRKDEWIFNTMAQ